MSDVAKRLQKLHDAFAAALPEKLNTIDALWQTVKQHGASNSHDIDTLYRAVHSLAGSAGTFGQKQTGNSARQLEQILRQHVDTATPINPTTIPIIETALHKLKNSVIHNHTNF